MASKKREGKTPERPAAGWEALARPGAILAGFAIAVLLFYYKPLFSNAASIQWDAADMQYSPQHYLSEMLREGRLPHWTPYVYSGMPLLADPQVGAWYPLNWPFFLLGVTPKAIEWELALHCFIAAIGGYVLARDLLRSRAGAVFAGIFFAFSGLFAETSSHPGPFQATALLPWLLWSGRRAARSTQWLPVIAIVSGALVLVGHFQTALYSFFALAVFVTGDFVMERRPLWKPAAAIAVAMLAAFVLSAVMVLPGLELTGQSIRAGANYSKDAGAVLVPGALVTLVNPNYYGAPEVENYTGPQDITQFYLYMGILLLPLAIAGAAARGRERWLALALVIAGVWYSLGPAGGLYSVIAMLPGFGNVRAPIQMWFVAAMGLAILAGAGIGVIRARYRSPYIVLALLAVTGIDLYYWNMEHNGLTYARVSWDDHYGAYEDRFKAAAAPLMANPMHRIWSPAASASFGPLNGSLDNRMEVTFGYNPLELARYSKYLEAIPGNAKLMNGLGVTAMLGANGMFTTNPAALPRIYAPETVTSVARKEEAAARLASLDPAREAVVEGVPSIVQNGGATVQITGYEGDVYRARYQAAHPTLLRIAAPYFPGWAALVDGAPQEVVPADLALIGVVVPAGSHELLVRYRSSYFGVGAVVSAVGWVLVAGWMWWSFGRRRTS